LARFADPVVHDSDCLSLFIILIGDRLTYEGDVSTKTAALETFKLLLNSVISTAGAKMCTGKFLYYARAIDNTMLRALNDIASSKNTNQTIAATRYFLNYAAKGQ
jgi:hypothetical protein